MGIDMDLSGLTDAEREALEGEDLETGANAEGDDLEDAPAPEDDSDEDDGQGGGGAADADGIPQPADEAEAEAEAPGTASFSVQTGDLAEIEASINALKKARDELETAYESGDSELTYAEHRAKLREIEGALHDLTAERAEVRAIQKMNAAYQQEWWNREIKAFKREAVRADGVDYDKDPKLEAEWDKAVRYLGSDPENANREAGWFLKEAHEIVKARFRLGKASTAASEPVRKVSRIDEALAARRQKQGEIPKTLAQLPEAGSEPEGKHEFSYLDDLKGPALERALAKMGPEEQARYLMA